MTLFAALLGLIFGSFLNVLIERVPKGESVARPGSRCPVCKNPLKWSHNIPIFSYLYLKGRCAFCDARINPSYIIVEALSSAIFAIVFLNSPNIFYAVALSIAFGLLLALSVIDLRYKEAPDSLNLSALAAALAAATFYAPMPTFVNFLHLLEFGKSALLLAGFFTLLRFILSFLLKKESMGEADIIVAATLGAILGSMNGFFAIFVGALLSLVPAIIYRKKGVLEIAFIPYLTMGGFVVFLLKERLWFMG